MIAADDEVISANSVEGSANYRDCQEGPRIVLYNLSKSVGYNAQLNQSKNQFHFVVSSICRRIVHPLCRVKKYSISFFDMV